MDELERAKDDQTFRDYFGETATIIIETDTQMNFAFKGVFETYDVEYFLDNADMLISPGLADAISGQDPPPYEWFQDLPCALDIDKAILRKHFVIYAMTLEKENCKPRINIGSAADQRSGAAPRMKDYSDNIVWRFSKHTKTSLEDGYEITNVGLLVMFPRPSPLVSPRFRTCALLVEAFFTDVFWTWWQSAKKDKNDHYMRHACPWKLEELEWTGVNTHSPLMEGVNSIELTTEELEAKLSMRRQKMREYSAAYAKTEKGRVRFTRWQKKKYRASDKFKTVHKGRECLLGISGRNARQKAKRTLLRDLKSGKIEENATNYKAVQSARKNQARSRRSKVKASQQLNLANAIASGQVIEDDSNREDAAKGRATKATNKRGEDKRQQNLKLLKDIEAGRVIEDDSNRDAANKARHRRASQKKNNHERNIAKKLAKI